MRKNTKMFARVIALALATVMCFTACGGDTEESKTPSSTPSSEQPSSEEPAKMYWEMLDEVSDSSELPTWEGDTLEVNFWAAGGVSAIIGTIYDDNITFSEFERVTGVKFDYQDSYNNNGNTIDVELPKLLASKDFPTIIWGYNIEKHLTDLWENGYLADMTEYLTDGTLDQMTKFVPLEEGATYYWNSVKDEDGKYFALPYFNSNAVPTMYMATGYDPGELWDAESYAKNIQAKDTANNHTDLAIMVNYDVLKELYPDAMSPTEIQEYWVNGGDFTEEQIFDIPLKNRDDFADFLYDIQELIETKGLKDANGKPMEVTHGPHTETDNWWWLATLPGLVDGIHGSADYFVTGNHNAGTEDKVLERAVDNEYYVGFMKWVNKLVQDDIISQDSMLDNAAIFKEKALADRYAVYYGASFIPHYNEKTNYRPVWINYEFEGKYGGFAAQTHTMYYGVFKDALSEEELDQLMHAMNYLNSAVGSRVFWYGAGENSLLAEDENGIPWYSDKEVQGRLLGTGEYEGESDLIQKLGLVSNPKDEKGFFQFPGTAAMQLQSPHSTLVPHMPRRDNLGTAYAKFNPGVLAGKHLMDVADYVTIGCQVYGSLGPKVDGINTFWAARTGFENQVKAVMAAESDADFEKQYKALLTYCDENDLTVETVKEFNDLFVETNREKLVAAGVINK
ncbi:MAG: hypothetical protein E7293_07225 [Lachnospiraceae bacterium]|nr:hypothetical protein [Lachnospiraceae bacterium]